MQMHAVPLGVKKILSATAYTWTKRSGVRTRTAANLPFALLSRYREHFQCGNLTKVLMWPMGYEARTCPSVQVIQARCIRERLSMGEAWLRRETWCVRVLARWFRVWGGPLRRGRRGLRGRR